MLFEVVVQVVYESNSKVITFLELIIISRLLTLSEYGIISY